MSSLLQRLVKSRPSPIWKWPAAIKKVSPPRSMAATAQQREHPEAAEEGGAGFRDSSEFQNNVRIAIRQIDTESTTT